MSDNINKEFFRTDIKDQHEMERPDGKVVVERRGTIVMLEEWFRTRFRTADWTPMERMVKTFRKVRKLRQKPAHAIDEDRFDQELIRTQRDLVIEAYVAVRTIRLALANHRECRRVVVDPLLAEGKIRDF